MEQNKHQAVKDCTECGNKFIEQRESGLYECERCIGKHEH
ncbi:protein YhfH [Sporosarcina sp. CAU 1771]